MILEFNSMIRKTLIIFILLGNYCIAQEIDFGLEFRINSNKLSNRLDQDGEISQPGHASLELGSFEIPDYNFGFYDENQDTVYVRFNEVKMLNNFEIPVYFRYTTRSNFFFDLKISGGKHTMSYRGGVFRDPNYYFDQYGSFEDYQAAYGGTFNGQPVNGDPETSYNDTSAYINWFDNQVQNDAYSQANAELVEELKFRSINLWFGRKFLKHKRVHPFVSLGLHYRTTINSFRRKHFTIQDNYFGQVLTRRDFSQISEETPSFSNNAMGIGIGFGFDIYRYHFAATAEYSFNLSNNFRDKVSVFDHRNAGAGFRTWNVSVGVDLFSHDFKTKNNIEEIYGEEFQSLTTSINKNRKWSLGINVKSPIMNRMSNHRKFSFLTIQDSPDPVSGDLNRIWESLSFGQIDRVSWIPKFELGFRFNIIERLDFEIVTAFSKVTIDLKVQEYSAHTINNNTEFDSSRTNINYAVFRTEAAPLYLGGNVYYTLIRKPAADFRVYAGGGINSFSLLSGSETGQELGVNGSGNDIYKTVRDYQFHGTYQPENINNVDQSFYSDYAEDINTNLTPQQLLALYDGAGKYELATHDVGRTSAYVTINAGMELELNRFLFGLSGEFSLNKVDNFLVKNYFNLNLNFGYILVSKTKIKK